MCSVGDDYNYENETSPTTEAFEESLEGSKCVKCKDQAANIVLQNKARYCPNCLLATLTHRFKAVLGKTRTLSAGDTVLVLHRGGGNGTALLHLIRSGLDLHTPKRLKFDVTLLHIECCFHLSVDERRSILRTIESEAKEFGFKISFVSVRESFCGVLSSVYDNCEEVPIEEDDIDKLKEIPTLSDRKELLRLHEQTVLINVAKQLGCSTIFLSDLSNEVANRLLTDICFGRGSHMSNKTSGLADIADNNITILRPLASFTAQEICFYNLYNDLNSTVHVPQLQTDPCNNVQGLLEKFVTNLATNFPATASTILRTGEKLNDEPIDGSVLCTQCKMPIEKENGELCSAEATRFSQWISNLNEKESPSSLESYKHLVNRVTTDFIVENLLLKCPQNRIFWLEDSVNDIYLI